MLLARAVRDFGVAPLDGRLLHTPVPGGEFELDLARGRGGLANGGHSPRCRTASSGVAVVRGEACVRHDELDLIHRHAKFLGGGLGEFGPRPLTHFRFSDEQRHHPGPADVNALPDVADG